MDNLELKRAIKNRDEFLAKHDHLIPFQAELEIAFKNFGDSPYTNMQVIKHYLNWNLHKLNRILEELNANK